MLNSCRRVLAFFVAVCMLSFVLFPVFAEPAARFTGKVLRPDGVTPRSGVIVTLVDAESHESFRSQPTDDYGTFRLNAAPAGTYNVVAEAVEGGYLAGRAVTLQSGTNRPISLTLNGTKPNFQTSTSTGQGGGKGIPDWVKLALIGGISLGAAFVINEVTEDTSENASSPF